MYRSIAAICVLLSACAASVQRVGVNVLARGEPVFVRQATTALSGEPIDEAVELEVAEAPTMSPSGSPTTALEQAINEAKLAYETALDFSRCNQTLTSLLPVARALADGRMQLAAQYVFWRTACHIASEQPTEAALDAALFTSLGLSLPDDAARVSPDVELLIRGKQVESATRPLIEVQVTSNAEAAEIRVDGRLASCRTPCELQLRDGVHAIAIAADEWRPVAELRTVSSTVSTLAFTLEAATPDEKLEQWRTRYAAADADGVDSAASLRLLAGGTHARRLVLLTGEPASGGLRSIRGSLSVDGQAPRLLARTIDEDETADASREIVLDLLHEGAIIHETPLHESPWFWIGVGGAAALAATITGVLLYQPEQTLTVRLP